MIRLESVGLRYGTPSRPGPLVLEDISFSLPAGGFRWLQGPSGAGKSSLMRLLHLELLPNAGKLVVLDHGRIVEQGSHAELLALNGVYHELVNNQAVPL